MLLTYKQDSIILGNLTYEYDLAGNRTKVGGSWARTGLPQAVASTTYNAANRQGAFDNTTLSYDDNGNLTAAQDASGSATYGWNARNQMTGITTSNNSLTAGFAYDPLGRRTTKTINGVSTSFLYDGLNPVQEKAGATVIANILPGLGMDEYFTRTDSAGTRTVVPDALGSTLTLTDAAGTLTTEYTYEPFGNTAVTGAASTNALQYTGRENDGTGLYYYRARYYSPRLQRFLSEDPIGFVAGETNLFGYVGSSPIMRTDPYGLFYFDIGVSGGNGTVGGTVGLQFGTDGIYLYGGYGIGIGGAFTITGNSDSPQEGTALSQTASGGNGLIGGQVTIQGDTKGNVSTQLGGGYGVGAAVTTTITQTTCVLFCKSKKGSKSQQ